MGSLTKSCPRLRGKWTRSGRKGKGSEQPSYFIIPPQSATPTAPPQAVAPFGTVRRVYTAPKSLPFTGSWQTEGLTEGLSTNKRDALRPLIRFSFFIFNFSLSQGTPLPPSSRRSPLPCRGSQGRSTGACSDNPARRFRRRRAARARYNWRRSSRSRCCRSG